MYSKPQFMQRSIRTYSTYPPVRRAGALKGGFLGFLLGVTLTGAASYFYLLEEYKSVNNVIAADVTALQHTVSNLERHVKTLQEQKK